MALSNNELRLLAELRTYQKSNKWLRQDQFDRINDLFSRATGDQLKQLRDHEKAMEINDQLLNDKLLQSLYELRAKIIEALPVSYVVRENGDYESIAPFYPELNEVQKGIDQRIEFLKNID